MKWKYLFIIDLLFVFQFIFVLNWYYPKTIIFTSGYAPHILRSILIVIEMIVFYSLILFNAIKAFSE